MWGVSSRRALDRFNTHARMRFDVKVPSSDALDAVRDKGSRVCPPSCNRGYRAQGGECVRIVCKTGDIRGADGNCQPRRKRSTAAAGPAVAAPSPGGGDIVRCGRRGCRTFTNLKHANCWSAARGIGEPFSPERRAAIRACMMQ